MSCALKSEWPVTASTKRVWQKAFCVTSKVSSWRPFSFRLIFCNIHSWDSELQVIIPTTQLQGGLACCSPWGCKESDMTGQLNNNPYAFLPPLQVGCPLSTRFSLESVCASSPQGGHICLGLAHAVSLWPHSHWDLPCHFVGELFQKRWLNPHRDRGSFRVQYLLIFFSKVSLKSSVAIICYHQKMLAVAST